ncbi:MAG TPA: hypothetical protein ENO14_02285, partial [Chromatiales bacterium]|nr:hypothetical protein [Chromatiales bacterium]
MKRRRSCASRLVSTSAEAGRSPGAGWLSTGPTCRSHTLRRRHRCGRGRIYPWPRVPGHSREWRPGLRLLLPALDGARALCLVPGEGMPYNDSTLFPEGPMHRLLLALALLSLAAPARAQVETWRDVTLYQIVTDRFFDGEPSNNDLGGTYDPSDGYRVHGGDFQGLTQRLDYIAGLGVDGVWISPVVLNARGEYHGYAARDLFAISDQMGGEQALVDFVAAAHARGLLVILDVVANHMGNLIGSFDAGYPDYDPDGGYALQWWNPSNRYPAPFDDLSLFHPYGEIQDFSDPQQILGELFGLDDLRTELPAVRDILADAYIQLIQTTDCDGFRIDTVKHAELGLWQDFAP